MIVGEHHREGDIVVNVCKVKKLTNMRASGSEEAIRLIAPKTFNLEESLEYLERDELLEVTPQNIRMRKKILDRHERKKSNRVA
jgi:GTP-binding protein